MFVWQCGGDGVGRSHQRSGGHGGGGGEGGAANRGHSCPHLPLSASHESHQPQVSLSFSQSVFLPVLRMKRIRIRIHFGRLDPDPHWKYESGSRRAEKTRKSEENLSARYSFLRDEDFSFCSDVLYGGLGISKLQFLIKKIL
jgi:hypothetical protein